MFLSHNALFVHFLSDWTFACILWLLVLCFMGFVFVCLFVFLTFSHFFFLVWFACLFSKEKDRGCRVAWEKRWGRCGEEANHD